MTRLTVPLLAAFLLAVGCLPKGSLSSVDSLPADRYVVTVTTDVTTEPARVLAPFHRAWTYELVTRWARDFRDGSRGRYVRFDRAVSHRSEDGTEHPDPLQGAWFELRTFDSGAILAVEPLAGHVGRHAGNLEALDLLWAALSPAPPDLSRRGEDVLPEGLPCDGCAGKASPAGDVHRAVTSIPTTLGRELRLRTVLTSGWWSLPTSNAAACDGVGRCGVLDWSGRLEGTTEGDAVAQRGARPTPRPVRVRGRASGNVVLDTDAARVLTSTLAATRDVTTRWPAGALASLGVADATDLVQRQAWRITVRWAGTAAPPRFAPAPDAHASPRADALPLTLADGTTADGGASPGLPDPDTLPFLLLPDRVSSSAPETR